MLPKATYTCCSKVQQVEICLSNLHIICKELPELDALMIREANELEEIFVSEGEGIQKVEIPNLKFVVFENLRSLIHAEGIHFQAVKYRSILNCENLSGFNINS